MQLVDFGIITALLEEFIAIQKVFPPLEEFSIESEVWYRTIILSQDKKRTFYVVVGFQNQMGSLEASALTKKMIARWSPSYIILAGIAGSFHEKVKLGDVIVSQQVFFYDFGKAIDNKKQTNIQYRPQGYPCSTTLIRQSEAISISENDWVKIAIKSGKSKARMLKKKFPTKYKKIISGLEKHDPCVHFGTIASGSLVITSVNKKQELLNLHGKIIGVEMEGAGVMHSTFYEEFPIPAIVIKAISDSADVNKNSLDKTGYWREMALENSSRFVFQLISSGKFHFLNTDKFQLNAKSSSPTEARTRIKDSISPGSGSFLSFPKFIIPDGPLTGIKIDIVVKEGNKELEISNFVIEYINKNGLQQSVMFTNINRLEISEPIYAIPIGIYLVLGRVESIEFKVSTFGLHKTATWIANK